MRNFPFTVGQFTMSLTRFFLRKSKLNLSQKTLFDQLD